MIKAALLSACAISAWLAALAPAVASSSLTGLWLDQSGRAAIDIEPCGASVCGKIAWLKIPLNDKGQPKTDIHNDKPDLQARKICGLEMLYGFVADGEGGWKNGWIYDPSVGKTYNSNIHLTADGTLSVRGYIQFAFLGQTQIWTRPAGMLPKCE